MNRPQDIAVYGGYDSSGTVRGGGSELLNKPYDTVVQELMKAFPDLVFGYDLIMDTKSRDRTGFFKCSYSGVLEEGQHKDVGYIASIDDSSQCYIKSSIQNTVEAIDANPFIYELDNYNVTLRDAYKLSPINDGTNLVCGNGTVIKKSDNSIVMSGDILIEYITKPA